MYIEPSASLEMDGADESFLYPSTVRKMVRIAVIVVERAMVLFFGFVLVLVCVTFVNVLLSE